MDEKITIGARMKVCRMRKCLTQKAAAAELGVHRVTYDRWERGVSIPQIRHRQQVAHFVGWSFEQVADACLAAVQVDV